MHSLPDESSDGSQNVSNSSFKSINKSLTNHAPTTPTLINQKKVSSFCTLCNSVLVNFIFNRIQKLKSTYLDGLTGKKRIGSVDWPRPLITLKSLKELNLKMFLID